MAALAATLIYGINHTVAKGIMPEYVSPFAFILLRVIGATVLFWLLTPFAKKEKIARKDWGRFLLCAILGMVINMLAFFKGLQLSTPINSSVLITIVPIITVGLSAILIKEKITWLKSIGIVIGLIGALILILFGAEVRQDAPNIALGNTLFILNATAFGAYLILVKKLIEKYHPFTVLKWLFTIALIINLPITYGDFLEINWVNMPSEVYWVIGFVIIGTTFLTYLFNVFALAELKASTVSAFTYFTTINRHIFCLNSR